VEDDNSTKLKNLLTPLSSWRYVRVLPLASTRLQPTGYRVADVARDGDCKGAVVFWELSPLQKLQHETQPTAGRTQPGTPLTPLPRNEILMPLIPMVLMLLEGCVFWHAVSFSLCSAWANVSNSLSFARDYFRIREKGALCKALLRCV
jgi:hypothetical protein